MRARNAGALVRLVLILALSAGAMLGTVAPHAIPATSSQPAMVQAKADAQASDKQQKKGSKGKGNKDKKTPPELDSKRIAARNADTIAAFACPDLEKITIGNRTFCTHGDDPQLFGAGTAGEAAAARSNGATTRALCIDDGQSGRRVQLVYIYRNDNPNRLPELLSTFRRLASEMDNILYQSSSKTGGSLHVRFVTNGQCQVDVASLAAPGSAIGGFSATIGTMKEAGYDRLDRKYLMLVDTNEYCGVGTFYQADSAITHAHDFTGYARVDKACWDAGTMMHELSHTLGAVQFSAPHTSRGAHCIDEWDVMCYRDQPYHPQMKYLCKDGSQDFRLDCNNDDYFAANPAPGSYLASHWNIARSIYLTDGSGETCVDAAFEPDDAYWYDYWKVPMRAFTIGKSEQHAFCEEPGDTDWITFNAKRGKSYQIETSDLGPDVDTELIAYRGFVEQRWDGMDELATNDDRAEGDPSSSLTFTAARDETYLIGVSEKNDRAGFDKTYTLSVKEVPTSDTGALTLSRRSAKPNGGFTATMSEVTPGANVIFWWNQKGNARELGQAPADESGVASGSYTVPRSAKKGIYQIEAIASDNAYATADFKVDPAAGKDTRRRATRARAARKAMGKGSTGSTRGRERGEGGGEGLPRTSARPNSATRAPRDSLSKRVILTVLAFVIALSALPLALFAPAAHAQDDQPLAAGSEVIVVLADGEDPVAAAREMGIAVTHIYRHVFTGFSGTVLPGADGAVATARARHVAKDVSPDGEVTIETQTVPTGVPRVGTPLDPDGHHLDRASPPPSTPTSPSSTPGLPTPIVIWMWLAATTASAAIPTPGRTTTDTARTWPASPLPKTTTRASSAWPPARASGPSRCSTATAKGNSATSSAASTGSSITATRSTSSTSV